MPIDTYDIGKRAAFMAVATTGIRLIPGVITGIRSTQRAPGYRVAGDAVPLWTSDHSGIEQDVPPSYTLILATDLPDEIVAALWPVETPPAELATVEPPVEAPAEPTASTTTTDGVPF